MLYLTFWNCYPIFYTKTVQNKKKYNVIQYDRVKCLWFTRLPWTNLRWSIFAKIYFSKVRSSLDYFSHASFLADASLDIFLVLKFSRMAYVAAKYVVLTCIVPVVKIEGSAAMFPKLNLINQCDLQFLTIK